MDLHLSEKIILTNHEELFNKANVHSYKLLKTTIVNPYDLQKYDGSICDNMYEIQVEGCFEDINDSNLNKKVTSISGSKSVSPVRRSYVSKQLDTETSLKFQNDIWPINALEQKENFFKFGISPQFKLKGPTSGVEKLVNHQVRCDII